MIERVIITIKKKVLLTEKYKTILKITHPTQVIFNIFFETYLSTKQSKLE